MAIATTHIVSKSILFLVVTMFIFSTVNTVKGQSNTSLKQENDYCILLDKFLRDSVVNETYGIPNRKNDSLILIMDTSMFFKHCPDLHINSKSVKVFHTPKWAGSVIGKPIIPHSEVTPEILQEVIKHRKPYIVIYKIDTCPGGYRVYSFYRTTGASIVVKYIKQNDTNYKVESYVRGYF